MIKKVGITIIILIGILLVFWFVPAIPYKIDIVCITAPCGGPVVGTMTIKQFITQKIMRSREQAETTNRMSETGKYIGTYVALSNPNITLELSPDWVAMYKAPNFKIPTESFQNGEGRWHFDYYNFDAYSDKQDPTIFLTFEPVMKNGERQDGPTVYFKVIEPYHQLRVEQSSVSQIPVGLTLNRD